MTKGGGGVGQKVTLMTRGGGKSWYIVFGLYVSCFLYVLLGIFLGISQISERFCESVFTLFCQIQTKY